MASAPSSSRLQPIKLAFQATTIMLLPVWIAQRLSFFRDEGLEVALQEMARGAEIKRALRDGTVEAALASPEIVLCDEQESLRLVACTIRTPPLFLIAKPEIHSLADLRGCTFGVLSLQEGSSKLIPIMAASAGLSPRDYTINAVGGAEVRRAMLAAGTIDAGLQPFPQCYEAEDAGFNNLGWAGEYEPDWPFGAVVVSAAWAAANPDTTSGLLRALLRALKRLRHDADFAARIAADELGIPPALARRAVADAIRLDVFGSSLELSQAGLARIFENLKSDGMIDGSRTFDPSRFVAMQYLRAARAPKAAS